MIENSFKGLIEEINPNWKSNSRIFGEVIEKWVAKNMHCSCGGNYSLFSANKKSIDAVCKSCSKNIQIKSSSKPYKPNKNNVLKILAAEYTTTLNSIKSLESWDLMLVYYEKENLTVEEVSIIYSDDITELCVIPRKPLGPNARRAGWQGCYLEFDWETVHRIY